MKVLIKVHTVVQIRWRKSSSKSTVFNPSLSSLFLLNPTFSPSVHQGHTSKSTHLCGNIVQTEPRVVSGNCLFWPPVQNGPFVFKENRDMFESCNYHCVAINGGIVIIL